MCFVQNGNYKATILRFCVKIASGLKLACRFVCFPPPHRPCRFAIALGRHGLRSRPRWRLAGGGGDHSPPDPPYDFSCSGSGGFLAGWLASAHIPRQRHPTRACLALALRRELYFFALRDSDFLSLAILRRWRASQPLSQFIIQQDIYHYPAKKNAVVPRFRRFFV